MIETADESWMTAARRTAPDTARARFELVPRKNEKKSLAEGRPIFDDVEYVRIVLPGQRDEVHRPARDDDRARFARQYEAFKQNQAEPNSGTPLAQWAGVHRSVVEELAYFNVRTVEQLADVNDGNLQRMGPYLALRQKARDFLEQAKANAPVEQMRAELEKRDAQIRELREALQELAAKKAPANDNTEAPRKAAK